MGQDDTSKQFTRIFGENIRRAREWVGFSRAEVLQKVFNDNNGRAVNILSAIENGHKPLTISTLYKLCLFYQCSADFILGFSNEMEPNLAASQNGLMIESMRATGLEIADRISISLNKILEYLPRFEGQLLANSSKRTYQVISKYLDDPIFMRNYPDLMDVAKEMNENVIQFEITLAKYLRFIEMNAIQAIETL